MSVCVYRRISHVYSHSVCELRSAGHVIQYGPVKPGAINKYGESRNSTGMDRQSGRGSKRMRVWQGGHGQANSGKAALDSIYT